MSLHTLHQAAGWIVTVILAVIAIRALVQDWRGQFGPKQDDADK